jgi:carbon monoxide dehydrogenase subunit G
MEIQTKITINATAEKVWTVLTDFNNYDWNPFIKSIDGDARKGETIHVELGGMRFKPEVLSFNENQEFRWKGKLMMKGIFDGEHYFNLEEKNGLTLFTHGELFSGL